MPDKPISGLDPAITALPGDEFAINQGLLSKKLTTAQILRSPNLDVAISGTPFSFGAIGQHINATAAVTMTTFDSVESNQLAIPVGTMWPLECELGAVTLVPGAGVTLEWFDGSAVQTGTRTLSIGSGTVLRKVSNTVYRLTSNGAS